MPSWVSHKWLNLHLQSCATSSRVWQVHATGWLPSCMPYSVCGKGDGTSLAGTSPQPIPLCLHIGTLAFRLTLPTPGAAVTAVQPLPAQPDLP